MPVLAGVLDTEMTTTILEWSDEEMDTMAELNNSIGDSGLDVDDSDLRFKTPDGKRFKISGWLYSQDDEGNHELVCTLTPDD